MTQADLISYVVIPALIMLARIFDVTIGTIRIIAVARGHRFLAPVLGFFEVLIWLVAIGQVMQNLTNVMNYFAYAFGFGAGNYIGIRIENKLAMGRSIVRVITQKEAHQLVTHLREAGYGVTAVDAEGASGPVSIIFTIAKRKNIKQIIGIIKQFNPNAFYTVEDVRFVSRDNFPVQSSWVQAFNPLRMFRKGR